MRRALLLALCVVLTGCSAASDPDGTDADTAAAATVAATPASPLNPAIGALFIEGSHFCTASVVHSGPGDLLLTAAHCLHDGEGGEYATGISFAPGYHDGVAPYGYWDVSDPQVPEGWADSSDPDLDVGFATARQAGNPKTLESVTGANNLVAGGGFAHTITLTGYPDEREAPVVCHGASEQADTYQMRVSCPGFTTGTSGGPWVVDPDPKTELGTVVGVIGGYLYGGDDPDTSYSSYFDTDVATLYRKMDTRG
ncbi:serine protease [Amycolatopsis sp. BJA-103]|uniref:trypsin-like serine peptidase n=1 Tax=unclassified Amycolatopsis TaxID=2618356 RepID=UPI000C771E42|nr:serine protease [Amycolatopsis sp. BJA-103]AUI62924.1 serine protease [Amycolatopsis sp. BJA-103]PNE18765.1 serine protease [Amycolatopsis sp. BJA-103]